MTVKSALSVLVLIGGLLMPGLLPAQEAPSKLPPEEIIRRFAEKESEFRKVWQQYTYVQKIWFQVIGLSGRVKEEREMVVEIYFTTDGKRQMRTLKDRGRLVSVGVSSEDISDATSLQPFVLTMEDLPLYDVRYAGTETVDELDTYVFDVKPKKIEKKKRYFQGRIWVDQQDFQVVMTKGKAVPDYKDNKFPEFETVREQIDGAYWFPTWTMADDILHFDRNSVHVRQIMTYEEYKKFDVDTTIKYEPLPDDRPPSN